MKEGAEGRRRNRGNDRKILNDSLDGCTVCMNIMYVLDRRGCGSCVSLSINPSFLSKLANYISSGISAAASVGRPGPCVMHMHVRRMGNGTFEARKKNSSRVK